LILIRRKWIVFARGFTQLSVFIASEIAFICGRGAPCENCPVSYGICRVGTTQRLAFIRQFPFYITLIFIAVTGILFGTLSCGWTCPIGFIQDILGSTGLKKINIPSRLKVFRYFSIILLAVLVFLELRYYLFSKSGIGIFHEVIIGAGILILLPAIFIKRFFCRFLCPVGLIFAKFNRLSPLKVKLDSRDCGGCGECGKACISDINPPKEVNKEGCLKCFNCAKVCGLKRRGGYS